MKKILIVTTIEATVRAFLLPHIAQLQKRGVIVHVACKLENNDRLRDELDNVVFHDVPFNRKLYSPRNFIAAFKIRRIVERESYDLISVHTPIASFLTRFVNNNKITPLIYTAHGFHFNENGHFLSNFFFRTFEKIAGRWLNKLIVINKDDYNQAIRFVPRKKVRYIPGIGIDESQYNPKNYDADQIVKLKHKWKIPLNKNVIIHIAEMNENKRQMDIITAANLLRKQRADFIFLLVGDGHLREEIEERINNENLSDYIYSLGYRRDINDLLAISDIGLNLSLREGLPRSIMEMMAMQKPVIATNIRGNRDLIQHNKNGFLIPVKDGETLAKYCVELFNDSSLKYRFGNLSRNRIETEFSLTKVLIEMDKVYKEFNI